MDAEPDLNDIPADAGRPIAGLMASPYLLAIWITRLIMVVDAGSRVVCAVSIELPHVGASRG